MLNHMRKPVEQPSLFDRVPVQPRYVAQERPQIYAAVRFLRMRGKTVYRAGRGVHSVDGQRCTTEQLLALARLDTYWDFWVRTEEAQR